MQGDPTHNDARIIPFPGSDAEASTAQPLVSVNDLTLSRASTPLLNGVTLDVTQGGVTALLGPNGAGKSLLLRAMAGLIPQTSGTIRFAPGTGAPGMVFQRPVLLSRSVTGNLRHALRLARVPRRDRTGRMAELLVLAGLSDQASTPARQLSGGEAQRLAIARALAARPRLLLMDEPTSHLDPAATAEIEALTRATVADGVTVIFVTHDRAQAARVADEVAFLSRGRIVEHQPAAAFFAAPASGAAQAYLAGQLDG